MATAIPGALGEVTHYFGDAGVAVVKLQPGTELKVGDHVHFRGHTTDFEQDVKSLQVQHHDVRQVHAEDDFGVKVEQKVREGDHVYQ